MSKRVTRYKADKERGHGDRKLVFRFDSVVVVLEWVLPQDLSF